MYGDHHVVEVRRILLELPGVQGVYAISCFQVVEVTYNPGQVGDADIRARLEEAGYLHLLVTPQEAGVSDYQEASHKAFQRHTTAYDGSKHTVSFAQTVNYSGRPFGLVLVMDSLWTLIKWRACTNSASLAQISRRE